MQVLRSLTSFSGREARRVLLLIPLLGAVSLLFLWQGKPRFERSFTMYADRALDSARESFQGSERPSGVSGRTAPVASRRDTLFAFDPNRVTQHELEALGFTPGQASAILRYRESGAVFRRPEDFARCYTVSEAMYLRLKPYIRTGGAPEARKQTPCDGVRTDEDDGAGKVTAPSASAGVRRDTLFAFDPNRVTQPELEALGFTPGQASAILRYRESGAVFRRPEDFARCYTVSEAMYLRLKPYIRIAGEPEEPEQTRESARAGVPISADAETIELNGADSAALVAVRGIGPLTAGRIVRYRSRLGGFVRAEQLREIEGMTERNYRSILQQIRVDSSKIQKIDINFALPKRMKGHPYLEDRLLNRILKYRQLKGGWRSIEDLTEQHILTAEQARRLCPYLCFRTK